MTATSAPVTLEELKIASLTNPDLWIALRQASRLISRLGIQSGGSGPTDRSGSLVYNAVIVGLVNMRTLRVTFSDGKRYDVPLMAVAEHRAQRLMQANPQLSTYEALNATEEELLAWASSDMEWPEIEEHATKVKVDRVDEWREARKEIRGSV